MQLSKIEIPEIIESLTKTVKDNGGRLMLVGGCVRDHLMGIPPKDFDCEIYGIESQKLFELLNQFGKVDSVGESFQVYKLNNDIDVSLPRRERKEGSGHKGFVIEGDPYMSFEEACLRRDFTINAILYDPLTHEYIDPYRGLEAIKNKTLRMVSGKSFQEDSLRVLRLAQFVSRFNFGIEAETKVFAQKTDLSDIPKERIWIEFEKLLLQSEVPNIDILEELHITNKLFDNYDYETNYLKACSKNINQITKDLSKEQKLIAILTLFIWGNDINILDKMGVFQNIKDEVINLYFSFEFYLPSQYAFHCLSQKIDMKIFGRLMLAFGLPNSKLFISIIKDLGIEDSPIKPLLEGKDLIELGLPPGKAFKNILSDVYQHQLEFGIKTKEQLVNYLSSKIKLYDK